MLTYKFFWRIMIKKYRIQVLKMKKESILLPYALLILQSIINGLGDSIAKMVYRTMPVYSLLTIRYGMALFFLLLFWGKKIYRGVTGVSPKVWILPVLCLSSSSLCCNLALRFTAATTVSFIRSMPALFAPLLALIVYQKKYSLKHVPIQIIILLGLYLLCCQEGIHSFGLGEFFAILTAMLTAGSLVFGQKTLENMEPIVLTSIQACSTTVISFICAMTLNGGIHLELMTSFCWGATFYLAVGCSLLAFLLQNIALTRVSSREVSLLQCCCPVMTTVAAILLLNEHMTLSGVIGSVIILVCVIADVLVRNDEE